MGLVPAGPRKMRQEDGVGLVSVLLVDSVTSETSQTYILMAGPEELDEGLGQPEFPESSFWARHGQQAVGQVVLVLQGLMCERWNPA